MRSQTTVAGAIALSGFSATAVYAAGPYPLAAEQSWNFFNTSTGLEALLHPTAPTQSCFPYALSPTQGSYYMNGCGNTANGFLALTHDLTGGANTAIGTGSLYSNTSGAYNTAVGLLSMFSNGGPGSGNLGNQNVAVGVSTLFSNSSGSYNLAAGSYALFSNTTGSDNTAAGDSALSANSTGVANTAVGTLSLIQNSTGNKNTAAGFSSLYDNANGNQNVGIGYYALYTNLNSSSGNSSSYNVAVGAYALYDNATSAAAGNNTAVGYKALIGNTGVGNTALGNSAGSALTSGSYNTYIGNGVAGVATESYVTRIGVLAPSPATGQTIIANIWNTNVTGNPVMVNANGQLGVVVSSERYKTDIASLGTTSDKLAQLRPVSFHLKSDPKGAVQYGLIAEEVDKVYPELVIHDNEGKIQGVRYDELAPMLLNELQKEQTTIATLMQQHDADAVARNAQDARISSLEQQVAKVNDLEQRLNAALQQLKANDALVVQR